jgi:thioredoxin reductase
MDNFARDAGMSERLWIDNTVKENGMSIITGAKALEITDTAVIYEKDGETISAPSDTVLYAIGMRPNEQLYFDLNDKAPFVTLVGDAKAPGKVAGAIHSGFFAAMDI